MTIQEAINKAWLFRYVISASMHAYFRMLLL
jgi:hypothetical protein